MTMEINNYQKYKESINREMKIKKNIEGKNH